MGIPMEIPEVPDLGPKYIPIEDIVELIGNKGLTYEEAGKILGIAKQSVWERCKKYGIEREGLKKYKKARAEIFALTGKNLFDLTQDDIKGMNTYQRIVAGGILYDKERLERDKSTSNVSYADVTKSIQVIEEEIRVEKAKLGYDNNDLGDE
ncbi:unnamed protein product [marine sediment metagenome]|uniref:Uncharacterized protein n=1 Tax=marine sediment metagenome TaxID=412755 RepID=X0XJ82_9ZZZZ